MYYLKDEIFLKIDNRYIFIDSTQVLTKYRHLY